MRRPWRLLILATYYLCSPPRYTPSALTALATAMQHDRTPQRRMFSTPASEGNERHLKGQDIDQHHQELIFERINRIDESRSRQNGGSGLGLSIVSGVARRHRGYVSLTSHPGKGSTFAVTLPLYAGDSPAGLQNA